MTIKPSLRELSGLPDQPAPLSESTLVMIDCQNTYTRGVMELEGVDPALDEAAAMLDLARQAGIPIFHIVQEGETGSPYDLGDDIGHIVDRVAPRDAEPVITKAYPNAFTGTELDERLSAAPGRDLILAGFMTHMCVNSTARGAFNLGYRPTVVGGATATRALAGPGGQEVTAAALQMASLAAISDLFGIVVATAADIPA